MPEIITENSKMAFGQYKDYPLVSVPAKYLLFLHDCGKAGRYADYIKQNMDVLIKQAKKKK
jgi:uncharacterized protein (DUF3820 family)